MDQLNMNMRQRGWLIVVKDYDCEILYHPRNTNIVHDALSRKIAIAPIRDVCMRITVITPLLESIREARVEAIKEEHRKSKRIVGQVTSFDYDTQGLLTLQRRLLVPYCGVVR